MLGALTGATALENFKIKAEWQKNADHAAGCASSRPITISGRWPRRLLSTATRPSSARSAAARHCRLAQDGATVNRIRAGQRAAREGPHRHRQLFHRDVHDAAHKKK